jgi:LysM repeat protein
MSKKKKNRLLLNLKEGERYKHRVAMVNEEGGWNQHEPNAGMARMFVIMLLIHVLVIGGIIVYDFVNGEDNPAEPATRTASYIPSSALPPPAVNTAKMEQVMPLEDYATYEWRSGDSLPAVAAKLEVPEEVLIKLNMLDKGAQIDQNTILRYPRRPVQKAVPLGVAGTEGVAATAPAVQEAPPAPAAADESVVLTPPGDQISLEPTLLARLTPAPEIAPGAPVDEAPPPAPAAPAPKVAERAPEKAPEVPKAVPVTRDMLPKIEAAKQPNKMVVNSPASSRGSYVVKSGETLYGIATKHRVTVAALQKANNISNPDLVREGMKLVIPGN